MPEVLYVDSFLSILKVGKGKFFDGGIGIVPVLGYQRERDFDRTPIVLPPLKLES
jgi:hypothetical protein